MYTSCESGNGRIAICAFILLITVCSTGCSTLSSLGLPFGTPRNRLLKSAKEISEIPGHGILAPKELAITPMPGYVVEIGDTLAIETVSFDASIRLPGDQIVKPDGTISLGEFGNVLVTGKSIESIESELQSIIDREITATEEAGFQRDRSDKEREKQDLGEVAELEFESGESDESDNGSDDTSDIGVIDFDENRSQQAELDEQRERREFERRLKLKLSQNQVSVRLTNWDSKKIYVLGEVNTPGSFNFIGNETVLDAILEAGGLSAKANHHAIIVSRPSNCGDCRTVMKVCYDHIVQLGDASTNYQLHPGDRVFVPSMTFWDDVRLTLNPNANDVCPRCAGCQRGCVLPEGCE